MTIQHKDVPDAQRHEPKGASTAVTRTVYHSDGAGSGSWRKATDLDTDFSDKTKNKFGWNDIADSLYTSGSPRAITSGTRTQLTNNASAAQTDTSRLGGIWVPASNHFLINDLNAAFLIRINMKVTAAAAAGTPYIILVESQSDNGPTVVSGSTHTIKGGGNINHVSYSQLLYNGSFINNQPLKIYVTPDTNVNIYDIGFVVQRLYVET